MLSCYLAFDVWCLGTRSCETFLEGHYTKITDDKLGLFENN